MDAMSHIQRIVANATATGFEPHPADGFDTVLNRRKFMISRFAVVDAFVAIRVHDSATAADLRQLGTDAFRLAKANKFALPRGLGSAIEIHPITIAGVADAESQRYVAETVPTQWGCFTMHALIHDEPATTVTFTGSKIWGGAYIRGLKRQLAALVA